MLCNPSAELTDATLSEDSKHSSVVLLKPTVLDHILLCTLCATPLLYICKVPEEGRQELFFLSRVASFGGGRGMLESRECINTKCQQEKPTFLYTSACIVTHIQHLFTPSSTLQHVPIDSRVDPPAGLNPPILT